MSMNMEEKVEQWRREGFTIHQIGVVMEAFEAEHDEEANRRAAALLREVFTRLDKDSIAGRALARALGFSNDASLARAAAAFGVSKQYLFKLQGELTRKLGPLAPGAQRRGSSRPIAGVEVKSRP